MTKFIVVTGGCGFVGTNLISYLLKKSRNKIICIDDYSVGSQNNRINNKRVKYIKGNTKDINKILKSYSSKIKVIFHFGEFSRIYQSFKYMNKCIQSNTIGTNAVFDFCLKNKIKLIYSATSASLGNKGKDKNLSPYAFTKFNNLGLLENLKNWFKLKFEIIYFYNVYGANHISKGKMATVIGIFENQYLKKKSLTVVKPGTQTRRFTHILDTIDVCILAWKKNLCSHYIVSASKSYSIIQVAKLFSKKIKFLPPRKGERFKSSIVKKIFNKKIIIKMGKIDIKNYINDFKKKNSK